MEGFDDLESPTRAMPGRTPPLAIAPKTALLTVAIKATYHSLHLEGLQGGTDGDMTNGAVSGAPRAWLRIEGLAAFAASVAVYITQGGQLLWLIPLLLAVDVSMGGYLANPRLGAFGYNLAHNWALGLAILGAGAALPSTPLMLAGAILIGHVGMDRVFGYGLKYPTAFADTHLGRIGR